MEGWPFGETVLAWRLTRGMTQAQLADAARVPRPNLSTIERGDREVTLRTLRALALALDVRPGILVDGIMPGADAPPLTRVAMERIARAAVNGNVLTDPRESMLSRLLRIELAVPPPGAPMVRAPKRVSSTREVDRAHLLLKGALGQDAFASLCERTRNRMLGS